MMKDRRPKIKVLLVDDHPVVREGLRISLSTSDQVDVIGCASDGEEAIRLAKDLSPDVVIMDISMPNMNGLEATRKLHKAVPRSQILILTMHDNKEYILQIIKAGAKGYVLKDIYPADLIRAIEAVHAGEAYFSPVVNRVILNEYIHDGNGAEDGVIPELSQREREVLSLIAEGHTNKIIANRLYVSVRTIETHRERIMKKLNIHSAAGLTKFAISKGMVKLE